MRNKKLISLICALSMIFTMFSAVTIVNAEEKGIALSSNLSEDGKIITIEATAVGITAADNFTVNIPIPEGVTKEQITVSPAYGNNILSDGTFSVNNVDMSGNGMQLTDGKLVTITITLDVPLSKDYECKLVGKSAIKEYNAESYKISNGSLTAATTTVEKWKDPNAKDPVKPQPTAQVVPPAPEIPTPVVPDEGSKGIKLDGTLSKDGKVITIEATAVGITAADNFTVNIPIPEGVTKEQITVSPAYGNNILSDGTFSVNNVDMSGNGMQLTDGKIVTITITMENPLTEVYECKLVGKSAIKEYNAESYKISNGSLTAASTVLTPSEEKPATKQTAELKKFVGKDKTTGKDGATVAKEAEDAGKTVYMTVEVKKDGASAVYGTDYVAEYNGTEIRTEEEFQNLVTGYGPEGTKIADVINGVTFKFFNSAEYTIDTSLQAVGDTEQLVNNQDNNKVQSGPAQSTPTPAPASVKVTADKTEISSDGTTRVSAVVTDAEGATPGTEVKFTVSSGADVLDFDGETEATVALDADKKASVRVYAKKVGTATVKAAYTYTDKDGAEQTKEGTVTIRVKNTTTGGGTGSDNKKPSTGGTIAGPADSMNPGGNWLGAFTDLDSVEWAKPSILALSLKGIVSGRGDGTFAPNDNITRAEYCQILIGAIEKSAEYADSEFADVPSDAWFYHAVSVASKYGIVSGYGDGNFGPYDLITRQDMALMTYKAAQVMNKDLSAVRTMSFADAGAISAYAAEAVQTLADASIINGVSDTEFAPKANATRAQAAKILYDTFVKAN